MSDEQHQSKSRQIDLLCDRLEADWEAGTQTRIEDLVDEWSEDDATDLIRELLVVEWELRRLNGEVLEQSDYHRRFPELSSFIETAFADSQVAESPPKDETTNAVPGAASTGAREHQLAVTGQLQIERFHAAGGLGEVYLATDENLQRRVAVKRIRMDQAGNPDSARRFQSEAKITGRLEHPGIVPLHGMGHDDQGVPFYVMKFIRGATLRSRIDRFYDGQSKRSAKDNSIEFRKLLSHFVAACQAIDYAHNAGVIHRDIKPDNVMIGKYGETQVVDWGLARTMDDIGEVDETPADVPVFSDDSTVETAKTRTGETIGTPAFMSPEQAKGRLDLVGRRSDVYSLGATLYVLCCGRRAFSGDMQSVVRHVCEGHFPRPCEANPAASKALEAVCLKAMRLEPEDRYASAGMLAEDIEAFLADQPVKAWREPWHVRMQRFLRQRQSLLLGAMLLLAVSVTVLIANAYRQERTARETAFEVARIERVARKEEEALRNSADRMKVGFRQLFTGLLFDSKPTFLLGVDYEASNLVTAAKAVIKTWDGDPQTQAWLMDTVGEHLAMGGQLKDAAEFLEDALQIRKANPDRPNELADSLHHVAFLRWEQGRLGDARELVSQAIAIRRKNYKANHERTLASETLLLMVNSELPEYHDPRLLEAVTKQQINAWHRILKIKANRGGADADMAAIHTIIAQAERLLASRGYSELTKQDFFHSAEETEKLLSDTRIFLGHTLSFLKHTLKAHLFYERVGVEHHLGNCWQSSFKYLFIS